MSMRLNSGGILINRKKRVEFTFDGKRLFGYSGDTLASALLANDQVLLGRSFKYHRPRGIVASGSEEPNALVGLGKNSRFEPNQRVTTTALFEGLQAKSQNRWPSLNFDVGELNSLFSSFFPAGFYYKTFMHPRSWWKHIFEPLIRRSAGLGKAPYSADADRYEHFYYHTDVLVVGAGIAGLEVAYNLAKSGAKILLIEQASYLGGRSIVDEFSINNGNSAGWIKDIETQLSGFENVKIRTSTMASGVYDHGYVLAYEQVADHLPGNGQPRHRLWRIRAKRVVTATGAIERPLVFPGNDVPGVMLASAIRDYHKLYGISPGDRTVVLTNNDDAYKTAIELNKSGLSVPAIIDTRSDVNSPIFDYVKSLGIKVKTGKGVSKVIGSKRLTSIGICSHRGEGTVEEMIDCNVLAISGGWSPVVHLWSHAGGKVIWDNEKSMFLPDRNSTPIGDDGLNFVRTVGATSGALDASKILLSSKVVASELAEEFGLKTNKNKPYKMVEEKEQKIEASWLTPQGAGSKLLSKAFIDFQNDVTASDIKVAALEGYESVEHTKRYTTLGMATDQGKLSNVNGLALLSEQLALDIQQVGTTTFRPPYSPISLGSIAGEARGKLFKATKKTSLDTWGQENGAVWEPVGDWRRAYTYLKPGESCLESVNREILNTRKNVGLLDASTLGKILVKGPDAARLLDLLYTNMISNLKVGSCRYGLMCNENGFLFDDGVIARLEKETFICHTTTGGADRVYSWIEEWLQTEWWDLQVFTSNLTEQYAQIGIAGPKSRDVLEKVLKINLPDEELPFMSLSEASFRNQKITIFRISFSGELSYEVQIPARLGLEFWNECLNAGSKYNIQPYGTEALHVMRAEKGFIMIGDETDGTVIPQDLNLSWAVSKKKTDFIGMRAQSRSFLASKDRKQLVGLIPEDNEVVLPDGAHAVEGKKPDGRSNMIGHVTSSYYSPTLGHAIALALVRNGSNRMGTTLDFELEDSKVVKAKVVSPIFYDPEGKRQYE